MNKSEYLQQEQVFFIHFKFRPDFSEQGGDPIALFRHLQELGKLTIIPHTATVPALEEYEPKRLYLRWTVKLVTLESQSHLEKILTPVLADTGNEIRIEAIALPPPDPIASKLAQTQETLESSKAVSKNAQESLSPMLVKIGKNIFSIARHLIIESLPYDDIKNLMTTQKQSITVKGETIALLPVHRLFRSQPSSKDNKNSRVIIMKPAQQKFGILVDEVISGQNIIKQTIDEPFDYLPGISGASFLDDGKIAFTLDVSEL